MMMWMQSFASERINRGGSRMEADGDTHYGIDIPSQEQGKDYARLRWTRMCSRSSTTTCWNTRKTAAHARGDTARGGCLRSFRTSRQVVKERYSPTDADLESDDALDAWMLREVTTGQHLTTTCRMGPASDPMNVVDQHGRVHGIEGLRVADASVMPDTVRANTNVTYDDDWGADCGLYQAEYFSPDGDDERLRQSEPLFVVRRQRLAPTDITFSLLTTRGTLCW